ncbi:MAG: methionine--tRNA ligase, partial [Candidatus Omnitrophica bacterium]|nr:methionine--tRNA ligase [Candidatus Omnitrophota bacterium]
AEPHIGHSYTEVAADALARYHRLKGEAVWLLTGTDEHGQKIARAAEAQGLPPRAFVDRVVQRFVALWQTLGIRYDDFIRTTEPRHTATVQRVLQQLLDQGDLYEAEYSGWYCTPDETFWTQTQITNGACPDCGRPVESLKERNYFLRMSKYQPWLVEYITAHPEFVRPEIRRNETLGFLKEPLNDLCVTRPKNRLTWGISVPFSPDHVTYVWFDALVNYISAIGYGTDAKRFAELWPADCHLIGKDILRPHTVYWPIMLHALGLELPRTVFAHGWWKIGLSKISKSRGNIVDPTVVIGQYGIDAYRYFLLREIGFGLDGTYAEGAIVTRVNAELANDIGNLLHRTLTMVEKHCGGQVPTPSTIGCAEADASLRQLAAALPDAIDTAMQRLDFSAALGAILAVVNRANKYIEEQTPWTLATMGQAQRLATVIYHPVEVLRLAAIALSPFIPQAAQQMWTQLGVARSLAEMRFEDLRRWGQTPPGQRVQKGTPLFPRVET